MKWKYSGWIKLVILSAVMFGCKESDYTRMVKSELSKDARQDSVLLGIKLGDSRNVFYGRCFELNKQQVVTQGMGVSVQYMFVDSTVHTTPTPIKLLFYPEFDTVRNAIEGMNMEFSYPGWGTGEAKFRSDSLKVKLMQILSAWYGGNEFIKAHINDQDIPVKVDGNRRIMVYIEDPQHVLVRVHDLLSPKYRHDVPVNKDLERTEK
jgi:hypothetical protein